MADIGKLTEASGPPNGSPRHGTDTSGRSSLRLLIHPLPLYALILVGTLREVSRTPLRSADALLGSADEPLAEAAVQAIAAGADYRTRYSRVFSAPARRIVTSIGRVAGSALSRR